jgi:hypothetical protein
VQTRRHSQRQGFETTGQNATLLWCCLAAASGADYDTG